MSDPETSKAALAPWQRLPRRTLTIALSVLPLVALANVAVLVWSLGGIDLAGRLVAPGLLLAAAGLAFVPMLANSLRFALWGRFLGLGLGFRGGLKVVTGTMVTNSITPSAAGGMPIKMLFLLGEGVAARRAATLISLQTAEDTLVMTSLAALCLASSGFQLVDFLGRQPGLVNEIETDLAVVAWIAGGVAVLIAALGAALAGGLLGEGPRARATVLAVRARDFGAHVVSDWLGVMRRGKGMALVNLVLALAQWLARFSIAGIVLAAFGQDWHPALYWLLQYLVQSISSVVPTPGGAGGAEAGFLLLFAPFVAAGVLVAAMSTWRLIFFYLPLAGAALVFFLLQRAGRLRAAAPDALAPGAAAEVAPLPAE
ncbi:lysylphosphatidylglycerol synthase domain-containing protein [Porphyrobacter sp. AAP82]|uniref:lysylphosphatidylglycerol synthase domain-containing protein n=1 Tax=Porphyrobacter sp. AAP82 TaxID=1248917 RepID=UPI0002EE35DE|nr:lysylphosphatidylglycerol synthase domain-containing protein [Porphyrobacter sp. AAP82]